LNLFEKRFKTPKTFKKSRKWGGCVGRFSRPSVEEGLAPPGFLREESARGSAPDYRLNLFEKGSRLQKLSHHFPEGKISCRLRRISLTPEVFYGALGSS
jgi:hypothetical protein